MTPYEYRNTGYYIRKLVWELIGMVCVVGMLLVTIRIVCFGW
jgi:hypothetical protein